MPPTQSAKIHKFQVSVLLFLSIQSFFYSKIHRYARLLKPKYGDGISSPPKSKSGCDLPNVRSLTQNIFGSTVNYDPQFTLINMHWGQTVAHDMAFFDGSTKKGI